MIPAPVPFPVIVKPCRSIETPSAFMVMQFPFAVRFLVTVQVPAAVLGMTFGQAEMAPPAE